MPLSNSIELAKIYLPILDEAYKAGAKTSILDGELNMQQQGANAKEIVIPRMELMGLADYGRNSDFSDGFATLVYETVKPNYDRGRSFMVDSMDDLETAGIAFGKLADEFIRMHVVPERDAFNISCYAHEADITVEQKLEDTDDIISALTNAIDAMDEAETPEDERYLFIRPTLHTAVLGMDWQKSRAILERFADIVRVPSSRMNSTTTLNPDNGWSASGVPLNFVVVHKPKVIQYTKHSSIRIFEPSVNQRRDAWKFDYRLYAITQVKSNKVPGIYCSEAAEDIEAPEE